tara:strand:+ start:280 stop:468 length:189 start_codon:yes stop_codon:yes gene_type:complete
MKPTTQEQRKALLSIYNRDWNDKPASYLKFRRMAYNDTLMNCVMVPWAGMWLGIESDGYTHS